jgi:hypothetical protein
LVWPLISTLHPRFFKPFSDLLSIHFLNPFPDMIAINCQMKTSWKPAFSDASALPEQVVISFNVMLIVAGKLDR